METIWDYLTSKGFEVTPRPEKKVVHLVLEQEKLNPTQRGRMAPMGITMEKLDGVYAMVTLIYGEARHWGRSGKALQNTQVLDRDIEAYTQMSYEYPVVLISEVTSDDPLAKLSGYLTPARVNDTDFTPTNMVDNFHDIITVKDFIKGRCIVTLGARLLALKKLIGETKLNRVPYLSTSFEVAHGLAEDYWQEGKEGVVYHQDAPWVAGKRDETKIKFKEKLSYDVTVIGVRSGKRGTKYEDTLGALIVAFRPFGNPTGSFIEVPVSGMADGERDKWWENPELILLKTIKMDAKSFTENGNLREPRYKEVRHDKSSDFPVETYKDGLEQYWKAQALHRVLRWRGLP